MLNLPIIFNLKINLKIRESENSGENIFIENILRDFLEKLEEKKYFER